MKPRRTAIWIALLAALGLVLPCLGDASLALASDGAASASSTTKKKRAASARTASKSKARSTQTRRRSRTPKTRVCRTHKGKRRCRWVDVFSGHGVSAGQLRTEPLPRPSGEIWVYSVNSREEVKVNIYGENGELDEAALATLDASFRCRRTGEARAVDPRLYEILSVIYDHFGQQRIELVSGFRNQPRQQGSRHSHASAMDIRIPGVPMQKLYDFATTLDMGNMGIGRYPTSDFVHVDYRAPGDKSYRWTDHSGSEGGGKKKKSTTRRRPNT